MEHPTSPASAVRGPLVLAFGDSLTAGYGLRDADGFAARLEQRLQQTRPGARVLNAGVSGDTTGMARARLPAVLSKLHEKPDLAIVQLGANDLLRGVPLGRTRDNLDSIITDLRRIGVPVLLASMEAPAFLGAFGRSCNALYAELAGRHGNASHPFLPKGILGNPAMCLYDRVHPNGDGVRTIVEAFLPAVLAELPDCERDAA